MKGIVRGVLALTLAVAAACTNDDTVEVGGDFDEVKVDRSAMFVSIGDSSAVLARLVNDLNSSTPTSFTVSNVGAGIQVNYDALYRPDYTNGDSLVAPLVKPQQRYWVVGTAVGLHQFTLTSSGASTTVNVYVTPDSLVNALSANGSVVAGSELTLTAPSGLRFNDNSVVTFSGGGPAPVITSRAADGSTITFLVGPGVSGQANVTNVSYLFAPAAPPVALRTTNVINVPAVTTIPLAYSATNVAAGAPITVTAAGFKFLPTATFTYGTAGTALVVGRSADSLSVTIIPPAGVTATTATVNNAVLANLTTIGLTGLTSATAITTGAPTTLAGTATPTAASPTLTVGGTVLGARVIDAGAFTGADILGGGGPIKWYRVVLTGTAQARTFRVTWDAGSGADLDFYIVNSAVSAFVGSTSASAGSSNPEQQTVTAANLPAGTYYIGVVNWNNLGNPTNMMVDVF